MKMFRYLPSRKVFFVALAAIGLLVWTVIYQGTAEERKIAEDKTIVSALAQAKESFPDRDNDGLYDWEEEMYGTDPENPDSDGNGIPDGEEYFAKENVENIEKSDSIYVAINSLGEQMQNVENPAANLTSEPTFFDDIFSIVDIRIVDGTPENEKEYIRNTVMILSQNTSALEEEPLEIVNDWLTTYSESDLKKLENIINENIQTSIRLIEEVDVPDTMIQVHLDIANNLYKAALSLQEIDKTTLDPTKGFFAAANYANYQSKHIDAVVSLGGYGEEVEVTENE